MFTGTRRADEDHADLISGDGTSRSRSTLLELLDTLVKAADDRLQLLELVLNETHLVYGLEVAEVGQLKEEKGN